MEAGTAVAALVGKEAFVHHLEVDMEAGREAIRVADHRNALKIR